MLSETFQNYIFLCNSITNDYSLKLYFNTLFSIYKHFFFRIMKLTSTDFEIKNFNSLSFKFSRFIQNVFVKVKFFILI